MYVWVSGLQWNNDQWTRFKTSTSDSRIQDTAKAMLTWDPQLGDLKQRLSWMLTFSDPTSDQQHMMDWFQQQLLTKNYHSSLNGWRSLRTEMIHKLHTAIESQLVDVMVSCLSQLTAFVTVEETRSLPSEFLATAFKKYKPFDDEADWLISLISSRVRFMDNSLPWSCPIHPVSTDAFLLRQHHWNWQLFHHVVSILSLEELLNET